MGDRFDWQAVHARLDATRLSLESGGEPSPEAARRILEERARKLAQPTREAESNAEELPVLVFSRAGERYGVDPLSVVEVLPLIRPTPLPGARRFLVGVIHHRGEVRAVFDLRRLLGGPGPENAGAKPEGRVVVVELRGMSFGLLADEVTGIVPVDAHEIATREGITREGQAAWIRGTTGEMVSVLDLDELARDPRITVNEG
ncbi:MAG TPA: chemotaxis protein CheW [Vicinamibacteria bacterium]|jgi:purine-binding chemotaxis protein CheW|nr:chemotaxis protein CheW [Vicinamibacteria bacterium]